MAKCSRCPSLALALAALTLAAAGCGGDDAAGDGGQDGGAGGRISGVVSAAASSETLAGATIRTTPASVTATSDGAGAFTRRGVPPGRYTVHAAAAGYEEATSDEVVVEVGGEVQVDFALAVRHASSCKRCHLQRSRLQASLKADPLPEAPGEGGSAGEG